MARRKSPAQNLIRFQASLSAADVAFLERKAREEETSLSAVLRGILRDLRRGLEKQEDEGLPIKGDSK